MKSKKNQPKTGVVVGDVAHKPAASEPAVPAQPYLGATLPPLLTKRKKIFVFILLAILMLASAGWLLAHRNSTNNAEKLAIVVDTEAPENFTEMTADQVKAFVVSKTGKTIDSYKTETYSSRQFKSFDEAYIVAQAFNQLGDYANSVKVFVVADSKSQSKADYKFYLAYSTAADMNGDAQKGLELLKKASAVAQKTNDSTTAANIDRKIRLREADQ